MLSIRSIGSDNRSTDVLALTPLLPELPLERTQLLDNLGRIRREVGPITPELSDALADWMNIRRGEVHEVVSFYSFLQEPVDVGACLHRAGVRLRWVREGVRTGALAVACVGHCDLAPVVMDGETVRGGVTHSTNGFLAEPDDPRDPPELPPDEVLARLEASGLTGMGGAGFPTFRKWDAVRREPAPRAVIVNADEGEPGTIKDRYVMELRPHLLLEGLVAAMRFCEVDEAYVYLREEYATSRARLLEAIAERGLNVHVVVGAGSYVCGEESAMLESMEGRRGMPRLRPPFPAQKGYLGRPTLINNVETLVHVARILRGEWTPGRLWSVSGAVKEPGLLLGAARRDDARRSSRPTPAASRTRSARSSPAARRAGSSRRPRSTSRSPATRCASGTAAPARRRSRSSPRATRCCACSPRRCASSPRSRARSARRAGSATARSTTSPRSSQHGRAAMTARRSTSGWRRWRRPRSAASARPRRFPVRNVFRHWPDLMEALGVIAAAVTAASIWGAVTGFYGTRSGSWSTSATRRTWATGSRSSRRRSTADAASPRSTCTRGNGAGW